MNGYDSLLEKTNMEHNVAIAMADIIENAVCMTTSISGTTRGSYSPTEYAATMYSAGSARKDLLLVEDCVGEESMIGLTVRYIRLKLEDAICALVSSDE